MEDILQRIINMYTILNTIHYIKQNMDKNINYNNSYIIAIKYTIFTLNVYGKLLNVLLDNICFKAKYI